MSMTIGRASVSTNPSRIAHDGDALTFNLDLNPGTLVAAKVLRQQLTGLVVGEVIPVTFSLDTDFDGFYEVTAPVLVSPTSVYLSDGFMRAVVSLRRIGGGYGGAITEFVNQGWDRATGAASTANIPIFPSDRMIGLSAAIGAEITTATGAVFESSGTDTTYTAIVPPEDFYNGACTIEYEAGGAWATLVGSQVPDLTDLRVGNGLVRFQWVEEGSYTAMEVEVYEGATDAAWQDVEGVYLTRGGQAIDSPLVGRPRVLRNDPDVVSVQWQYVDTVLDVAYTVVVTVNRGEHVFAVQVFSPSQMGLVAADSVDTVEVQINSVDRGYRGDAVNADGHNWLLLTIDGDIAPAGEAASNVTVASGETAFVGVNPDTTGIDEAHVLAQVRYATSQTQRVIT